VHVRYAPGHKQKTKERILAAARKVFQRQGYQATGVDKVMEEAGLTAGGFYAHFESKQALLAETLVHSASQAQGSREKWLEGLSATARARSFIDGYLSVEHCRKLEEGCPLPALVSETSRSADPVKESFESVLREFEAWLAACAANGLPEDRRLAIIALCAGGIALARSVADESFAERILAACRELAMTGLNLEPDPTDGRV
jgi:TetR/AcrR family transcriptional repressor of nem operon